MGEKNYGDGIAQPDAYQEPLAKLEEAETINSLRRALQEAERGDGKLIGEALPRLRERSGIRTRMP